MEHVRDMLVRDVRYHRYVRPHPQMITALRRERVAIPENDIRTIIGPLRHRCTTCMRADGGQLSNKTFCDIQKTTPTLFFYILPKVY